MKIRVPPNTEGLELRLVSRGGTGESDFPELGPETEMGALGNAWRQKNRGRSQVLGPQANAQAVDLVSVTGDDQLSRQMTLTCQVERHEVVGVNFPPVVGDLSWGNDGFQARAMFDFLHGAQVTLAGAFVRLAARFDTDAPGVVGVQLPLARVGAHLSYQPPATAPLYRTRYLSLLAGAAGVIDIPAFAERLDVLRTGPSGTVLVELLDRLGATVASNSTAFEISTRLPNDARQVRVTNQTASAMDVRAVFSLWL
jgi:hypothetical protein